MACLRSKQSFVVFVFCLTRGRISVIYSDHWSVAQTLFLGFRPGTTGRTFSFRIYWLGGKLRVIIALLKEKNSSRLPGLTGGMMPAVFQDNLLIFKIILETGDIHVCSFCRLEAYCWAVSFLLLHHECWPKVTCSASDLGSSCMSRGLDAWLILVDRSVLGRVTTAQCVLHLWMMPLTVVHRRLKAIEMALSAIPGW